MVTPKLGKKGKMTVQGRGGKNAAMVDVHVHGEDTERIMLALLEASEEVLEEWDLTEPAVQIVE